MSGDKKVKEVEKEVMPAAGVSTQEHFDEVAAQSAKNRAMGNDNVKVDLIKTVAVRFTKDVGFIKKGHEQLLSETAFAIYKKKDVVELI